MDWKNTAVYYRQHSIASVMAMATDNGLSSLLTSSEEVKTGPLSTPSSSSTPVTTSHTSSLTTAASSLLATSNSSPPPEAGNDSGNDLTTGAKAGIAIGAVGGALVGLLLGWIMFKLHQRRKSGTTQRAESPPIDTFRPSSVAHTNRASQVESEMRSPAWSGHKSELPADEITTTSSVPVYQSPVYQPYSRPQSSEIRPTPTFPSPTRPEQDGGLQPPGQQRRYYEMAG